MPHTRAGRSGGGGAAVCSSGWREPQHSKSVSQTEEPADPIRNLIALLDAAAAGCGVLHLRDGGAVQIARVSGGYSIGQRP